MHFSICVSYIELSSVCPEVAWPVPAGVILQLILAFSLMSLLLLQVGFSLLTTDSYSVLMQISKVFLGVKFGLLALSCSGQLGFPWTLCNRAELVLSCMHSPLECCKPGMISRQKVWHGRACPLFSLFSWSVFLLKWKTLASCISSGFWLVYYESICDSGSYFYMDGGRSSSFFLFCFVFVLKIPYL